MINSQIPGNYESTGKGRKAHIKFRYAVGLYKALQDSYLRRKKEEEKEQRPSYFLSAKISKFDGVIRNDKQHSNNILK